MRWLPNQCQEDGEKAGFFPCGGPGADGLTLLTCVHLFVALKWYMAMTGGCKNGLIKQL